MSFYEQSEPEFRIRQKGEPVGENPEFPAPRFYQIDSPIILLTESIHTGEACTSDRSRTRAFQRFRGGKQGRPRGQHVVDKDHPLPLAGIQGPEAPPCVFQPARTAQPALIPCTAGLEQALEGQAQKTRALPCEKLAVVETAPTTGGIGSRHAGERICRMQPARRDGASCIPSSFCRHILLSNFDSRIGHADRPFISLGFPSPASTRSPSCSYCR